jgi:putative oxidoreductase
MALYDKILGGFASTPIGGKLVLKVTTPADKALMRWSKGRFNVSVGAAEIAGQNLLLMAKGAKSGVEREAPLLFFEVDGCIGLIASRAGHPKNPAWYYNLKANPDCRVFVRGVELACVARQVEGEERERVWRAATAIYPGYDDYASRTTRKIPVFLLAPQNGSVPPVPTPFGLDLGLLAARVVAGSMMLFGHGLGKFDKIGDGPIQWADPIGIGPAASLYLAIFAEVVCSALLALGFLTRFAALNLLVTMLVAAFIVHGDDPWKKQEFALVYAIPFLTLLLTGPGRISLDHFLWGRKR